MADELPDPVPPLTEDETAMVEMLFNEFKDLAIAEAREYILAHTPARLQKAMIAKVDPLYPEPEPPTPAEPPAYEPPATP